MRRRLIAVGGSGVALGVTALLWAALDLPGRALVRGHLGDVGVVMLMTAILGSALPRLGPRWWIGLTAAMALAVETAQALGLRGEGLAGELTIGATFDPLDLVAYALGCALAWWMLRTGAAQRDSHTIVIR